MCYCLSHIIQFLGVYLYLHNAPNIAWFLYNITISRSSVLGTLARDFQFYRFAVYAAIKLRRDLCAAIINAPMIFFMTENLGPLTEVFTKDLGVLNAERTYLAHVPRPKQQFSLVLTLFRSV